MITERPRFAVYCVGALMMVLSIVVAAQSQAIGPMPTPTPTPIPKITSAGSGGPATSGGVKATVTPTPTPTQSWPIGNPCAQGEPNSKTPIDATRVRLGKTLCQMVLWLDGLSGAPADVKSARQSSGRVELSAAHSAEKNLDLVAGIDVDYRLPNLEHKLNAFIGRDRGDEFLSGRSEGFGLRSQLLDIEGKENWLAGLGYSLPGSYKAKTKVSIGMTAGRQPKVFVQGRYMVNFGISQRALWHFRETVFWRSRGEGFGATTSLDYDRVFSPTLLLRWGNSATYTQGTKSLTWRSAVLVYQNLRERRAMAYEAFLRGKTSTGVPVREYGARAIYREALDYPWVWGEVLAGYSWFRDTADTPRKGSVMVAIGIDMLFGRAE